MDKPAIYTGFEASIRQRIRLLQNSLAELKEAGAQETKSTAGDKHETALAMLQLEQEKKRNQLREAEQQLADLRKIDPAKTGVVVARGSVVITDRANFFICGALGKQFFADKIIMAISPISPLGKLLMGCISGDQVHVNSVTYRVLSVY